MAVNIFYNHLRRNFIHMKIASGAQYYGLKQVDNNQLHFITKIIIG
jgi:hypothetical protein